VRSLIIALALASTSCTANQMLQAAPVIGNVCSAAQGTLVDEKVVYAAEVLYNIPAQAYVSADKNHKITPQLKATLKPMLIKLNDLRNAVKAAKGSVNCDFASMKELQVQIIQLLPR
jgi:hypothetical protein